MREIKFRAYNSLTKQWFDWERITTLNNLQKLISLNHVDIMQFTGFQDENGNDIYEGDIVSGNRKNFNYKCVFRENGAFEFQNMTTLNYVLLYEIHIPKIIGNIYNNP